MENIDKIKCVLIDFEQNDKTLDEAANEILRLFSVVGRSEQSICTSCKADIAEEFIPKCHCPECGNEWGK